MRKLRILIVLTLTALLTFTCCVGAAPVQTGEAANDRPPAPAATPVSPLGQTWSFILFYGVSKNGLITQPGDQSVVAAAGTSMSVNVPLVTTNINGIWGFNKQRLSAVSYQQYSSSNGWPNQFTNATLAVGTGEPTTSANAKLQVPTVPGTYYYQLKLTYSNDNPTTVYSDVFAITVVPKPINATSVAVASNPSAVLWGQPIGLTAQLTPANSTATIAWQVSPTSAGAFTSTSGQITSFKTQVPATMTDAVLQTDSGTPINFIATATNPDQTTVKGTASATLGGLGPLTVQRGENFTIKPPALTGVQYPSTPQFDWVIYKDRSGTRYTPTADEHLTTNTDTLNWQNVQAPQEKLYYQLIVSFTNNGKTSHWYTNIAPLTITATNPELHAVPNLQFALSSGTNPTIADFYKPNGVMMQYAPSKMVNTVNWDGNNAGVLAITSGGSQWRLNVQFSPFKNMTTQRNLGGSSGGTAAFSLHFADGTTMAAKDDSQPVTLYNGATQNVTTTTSTDTSLKIPQTASIQPGTYQSTATWTLVKAP